MVVMLPGTPAELTAARYIMVYNRDPYIAAKLVFESHRKGDGHRFELQASRLPGQPTVQISCGRLNLVLGTVDSDRWGPTARYLGRQPVNIGHEYRVIGMDTDDPRVLWVQPQFPTLDEVEPAPVHGDLVKAHLHVTNVGLCLNVRNALAASGLRDMSLEPDGNRCWVLNYRGRRFGYLEKAIGAAICEMWANDDLWDVVNLGMGKDDNGQPDPEKTKMTLGRRVKTLPGLFA
jgi:hypothetical protein